MKPLFALRVAIAAAAVAGAPAMAATAQVEFDHPEKFTDAGRPHLLNDAKSNLGILKQHIVEEAAKTMPADQALDITVTDVDLAGAFEPWQPISREVRIVKDIYPPRIDLRFRLTRADGSLVKEGTRTLRDPGFLMGTKGFSGDALRYEKVMLDEWMEREFGAPERAAAK